MAKTRIQVDELASNGAKIELENVATYKNLPILAAMGNNDVVAKGHLPAGTLLPPVVITISPSAGVFEYILSPTELAAVNSLNKLPEWGAVTDDGQYWAETIKPMYTPYNGFGAFTQIKVMLNSDTAVTVVQFS